MPSRRDFDPVELRYALGNLLLMDVLGPPLRLRFRLIGIELTRRTGRDLTGRMVDDIPEDDYRAAVIKWHTGVVERRTPRAAITKRTINRHTYHYEILTVPLSDDGKSVNMTLTGIYYLDEE